MSQQNTRRGVSGSGGRSSLPNSGAFHRQRRDGVNKPLANDSSGSKDGVSQGRGKYLHNKSQGRGSRQFSGKPGLKYVYRQKSPATDVNLNSLEGGDSQLRQTECFVASDLESENVFDFSSDSKTPMPDIIPNLPMAEGIHMKQLESFPLLDSIKETLEEEREGTAAMNNDFSSPGEVKDELVGKEPLLPAKTDIQEQAFRGKDVKNFVGIGGSGHSVPRAVVCCFDICPPKTGTPILLKPSLLVTNRQKRNQVKLDTEGPTRIALRSGMVLLKNYLFTSDQVKIVKECRNLGLGPGGFYQPGYRGGATLHLNMMCLGKNWDPQKRVYEDIRSIDGAKPPIIPAYFNQLVREAIKDSHALIGNNSVAQNVETILPMISPDICIVNFYKASGKLGLHQDRDESQESLEKGLPVVSFSIGDTAEFLYGDEEDVTKAQRVNLESGDVLIFGGKSRHIFHGVRAIITPTTPKALQEETNIRPGRLNLTFRQY
ncbi:uncharacterized protein LOC123212423 isoform X2 [Mangifera indica]|uniref:uncharacterized protein LOC123212423 isoform X2 n=1 Tax=Mangifera indica TaxID=29780 RepID=UPI001CFA8BF1|nr:uncharacterized protein LOC123212423 isoform X2 [Mangifera indica]